MVLRLARQTRDRRVLHSKLSPTVGRDHADLGQWLSAAVVGVVLIAETVVIATSKPLVALEGGTGRLVQLLLVLVGSVIAFAALWQRLAYAEGILHWLNVVPQIVLLLGPLSVGLLGGSPLRLTSEGLLQSALPMLVCSCP